MWADVVHLEEPFYIQARAARIAKALGIPCTATYHLHPENMTASVGCGSFKWLNNQILSYWKNDVFDFCSDVQCPTENVAERLKKNKYKADLHIISNGIILEDDNQVLISDNEPFRIICTGRFSKEKEQYTLLEAMKYSKYAAKIQLYFAGRGPMEKKYKNRAEQLVKQGILSFSPVFAFYSKNKLKQLSQNCHLYIHCASIEVEGLSCLETIQQGVVPIIASSELSATSQFALDERSIFPAKDCKALAERIDYWYEHSEERVKMSQEYKQSAQKYDINKSISDLICMFERAVYRKLV